MTESTGFLGTQIVSTLLKETDKKIYTLVRANDMSATTHRLKSVWFDQKEIYAQIGSRVIPVAGDFTKPNLGVAPEDWKGLAQEVAIVPHAGAEVNFQKDE